MSKPQTDNLNDFSALERSNQENRRENQMDNMEKAEVISGWLISIGLLALGITCLFLPAFLYTAVINLAVLSLFISGVFNIAIFLISRSRGRSRIVYGLLAIAFSILLMFNHMLPEWIIRVSFGLYAIGVFICMLIQVVVHYMDGNHVRFSYIFFALIYGLIGAVLLFTDIVTTQNLIRLFGIYFCVLAVRFMLDLIDRNSSTYEWKRSLHVSLPTIFAAAIPDFALRKINEYFQTGKEYPLRPAKKKEPVKLKAMVHIGPDGFQKVGHFTFSWKGIVYSYGNYDKDSERLMSMLGDGVFFTVPQELYLPNIITHEKNTIFEYGIETTPEQDAMIEKELEDLKNRSYRWYSLLERRASRSLDGLEEDYPSRLHYRTGAKFYKIKKGCFKTYWVAGENCVQFADVILGRIGSDVLSLRGIVTPGAYYDYLENEYTKERSPVVERKIYSPAAGQEGI